MTPILNAISFILPQSCVFLFPLVKGLNLQSNEMESKDLTSLTNSDVCEV